MPLIRVAIIEDDITTGQLWQQLLNSHGDYDCRHVYTSVEEAIESLPEVASITLVLLDENLGDGKMPGHEGITELKKYDRLRQAHFVMVTVDETTQTILEAIQNGASGYILKNGNMLQVLNGLEEVMKYGSYMTPQVSRIVMESMRKKKLKGEELLTSREMEILQLLKSRKLPKDIALELRISLGTVRKHQGNIYEKLKINRVTDLYD